MRHDDDLAAQARALFESETRYFSAAASVRWIAGARLAVLPGLAHLAGGCVLHRVRRRHRLPPRERIERWEQAVECSGGVLARIYLCGQPDDLEETLRQRGYRSSLELGLILTDLPSQTDPATTLRRIETPADWLLKLRMHGSDRQCPDGHRAEAEDYVALEQRKCAAGYMEAFLVEQEGAVCGALGLAPIGPYCRLKNVFVLPSWRGQGVAKRAVHAAALATARAGRRGLGCLALAEQGKQKMYLNAGYRVVMQQTEWCRCLRAQVAQAA